MSRYLFDPAPQPALCVIGTERLYPVRRVFCVGRNYAAHAVEMGGVVDHEAPWYFTKSAHALQSSGTTLPYPPGTENFHYEIELALALDAAVFKADVAAAAAAIGYLATSLDMTRRDLQQDGKDKRRPWDLGKDVEGSAVITSLAQVPISRLDDLAKRRIHLAVNGNTKQDAILGDMVWTCAEIVSHLSHYYHLGPGDIVLTGTPAGVGPVVPGDVITGGIDGLPDISLTIGPAQM